MGYKIFTFPQLDQGTQTDMMNHDKLVCFRNFKCTIMATKPLSAEGMEKNLDRNAQEKAPTCQSKTRQPYASTK